MKVPDKSLGQHWLEDELYLDEIIYFSQISKDDTVVEIGPGPGGLTEKLCKKAKQVTAIEVDPYWADKLKNLNIKNLKIIEGDIRKQDFTKFNQYKVVANIPYYLTNYLTRLLTETDNPPESFTLLVQKEVAERMAAEPGDMSLLSLSVQMYGEAELGMVVPKQFFNPPPKVDSQIIRVDKKDNNYDKKTIFRLAKAGFANKRKKLTNSLAGSLNIDKDQAEELLKQAGIDKNKRAQALSLQKWQKLSEVYSASS